MKTKAILSSLLVCIVTTLSAQINLNDSTVQVVAYWSKGDSYDYLYDYYKYNIQGKDTISWERTIFKINITVIDSTDNTYTLQAVYDTPNAIRSGSDSISRELTSRISRTFGNDTVIVETNELGTIKRLVNFDKLRSRYLKAAEMTAEALSAQQGSEAQKDSLFRFLKSTLSKQMGDTTVVVSTALEELSFLLYYHGCKMDFDEEYQIEENFPSLLGGAPCKGMRTFWIDEVDPENGSFRIASDAIVNTDQAIKQFIELIQSNLPEEDRRKPIDSSQIPIIMAQDQNDTYIHADTGWPLVVYYTRTTQVGENRSGIEISLEIDIPE